MRIGCVWDGVIQLRMLEFVKYEMYSKALEAFGELGEDEELGPADWTTVHKYVSCLADLSEDGRPAHPHEPLASDIPEDEIIKQQLQDTRLRFLNGKFTINSCNVCNYSSHFRTLCRVYYMLKSAWMCISDRVVLSLNGTFCQELVPYEFLLVGLHTILIVSFHL